MIKVRSKTLFIPAEEQSIGAVGEADSTVREFHIDRVSGDGVDLANLLFKLNIRYAGVREIDRSDLEKVVTDNAIILRWLISSVTLRNAGTAFLQLDAFDETGSCRWKSYPGAVYIEKSLGNTEVPSNTLSELEQLEKKFAKVGEGESARVEAEKKRVIAEEKREEAEGKRNTSLASIVAEEEKIKAVSAETKGYKDSVKADKDAIAADRQAITAIKNETISARDTAQQHASAAEVSKNNTITEGAKIKEAVIALKNEANTAKTDAVNAKNEAVSAKNVAETARQQAEGYKTEASTSAQKAKESETKTLEALKKAEKMGSGGAVNGVTETEMHEYVSGEIGKVRTGVSKEAMEGYVETKSKEISDKSIKEKIMKPNNSGALLATKTFFDTFNVSNSLRQWTNSPDSLVTANDVFDILQMFGMTLKNMADNAQRTAASATKASGDVAEFLNVDSHQPKYYVLQRLKDVMRTEGRVPNIGDYIIIGGKKFYVAGVNCQFNSNRNGDILPIENHVDFICMSTGVIPALSDEQIAKYKADPVIRNDWSVAAVNKIMQECVFQSFQETLGAEVLNEISEKFVGFYGEDPLFQKLWIPTEKELLGTNVGNPEYKGDAIQGQYPYFVLHPNAYLGNKLFLLAKSIGEELFLASNGLVVHGDYGFLQAKGDKNQMIQIPIGFRIQI